MKYLIAALLLVAAMPTPAAALLLGTIINLNNGNVTTVSPPPFKTMEVCLYQRDIFLIMLRESTAPDKALSATLKCVNNRKLEALPLMGAEEIIQ